MRLHRVWALAAAWACAPAALGGTPERLALSFEGGYQGLNGASDSAKAVFAGSTGGGVFGGALRLGVGRSLFVGAGARVFSKEGERVFVDGPGGTVFPLGHPLKVRLLPIYGFVGWRFRPESALVPYVSAGGGVTSYREESTIGGITESESVSKASWHAALGADYAVGSFGLGVEARWSGIPNVVGLSGVSRIYGETDLGGFSVVGRVSFRR
jgi:hypothetical protein